MHLNASEIPAPFVQLLMGARDGLDPTFAHEWMCTPGLAVLIKFLLQQVIDGGINGEGKARWLAHAQAPIKVETARTVDKQLELRARQFEGLSRRRVKQIPRAFAAVALGHQRVLTTYRKARPHPPSQLRLREGVSASA